MVTHLDDVAEVLLGAPERPSVRLRLVGVQSNRDGLEARVKPRPATGGVWFGNSVVATATSAPTNIGSCWDWETSIRSRSFGCAGRPGAKPSRGTFDRGKSC